MGKYSGINELKALNLETNYGRYDTRKSLNRAESVIPSDILTEIEDKGLSIERLNHLSKINNLPVFYYLGQVTIHGIWDDLKGSAYIGGYKSLVRNGNGSLGVRYNAIDDEKVDRLLLAFEHLNHIVKQSNPDQKIDVFKYYSNSKGRTFAIGEGFYDTEEQFYALLDKLRPIYEVVATKIGKLKATNVTFGINHIKGLWGGGYMAMGYTFHCCPTEELPLLFDLMTYGFCPNVQSLEYHEKEAIALREEKRLAYEAKCLQEKLDREAEQARKTAELTEIGKVKGPIFDALLAQVRSKYEEVNSTDIEADKSYIVLAISPLRSKYTLRKLSVRKAGMWYKLDFSNLVDFPTLEEVATCNSLITYEQHKGKTSFKLAEVKANEAGLKGRFIFKI